MPCSAPAPMRFEMGPQTQPILIGIELASIVKT